jgi:CelD/BcsL family acetyltransferase involved in cellulose biosynthesis
MKDGRGSDSAAQQAAASAGQEISWLEGREALSPILAEWQELADQTGADIFLTPDWFTLWWTHFGQGRQLKCMVARRGGRLVGFLPFCIDTIWLGPVPLKVARWAGTDPHCMVFRLPLADDSAGLLQVAWDYLLNDAGCAAVSLTPVSERAEFMAEITETIANRPDIYVIDQSDGSHVVFDLPDTFDEFLARMSSTRRGQYRKDLGRLRTAFDMQSGVGVPEISEFDDFVQFHNEQWQSIGKGGHFTDWPGSAAFYRALAARSVPGWGVRFDSQKGVLAGRPDSLMAVVFSLVSGKTCHSRLPARTLDPTTEKFSLGKVGLLLMIEDMIKSGIRFVEAGRGEYDYKIALGGQDVPVHRILITRAGALSRARLWMLLAWTDLLDFLHYRIWFKKVAPALRLKFGGTARPLWRVWIRSRI